MKKEMLINVLQSEECRIAIVEDGVLEELYVERTSQESYVGNIYKGKIVNIEPGIQAAFVDFGIGRNGFLHASDVDPAYYKHLLPQDVQDAMDAEDEQAAAPRPPRAERPRRERDRDRDFAPRTAPAARPPIPDVEDYPDEDFNGGLTRPTAAPAPASEPAADEDDEFAVGFDDAIPTTAEAPSARSESAPTRREPSLPIPTPTPLTDEDDDDGFDDFGLGLIEGEVDTRSPAAAAPTSPVTEDSPAVQAEEFPDSTGVGWELVIGDDPRQEPVVAAPTTGSDQPIPEESSTEDDAPKTKKPARKTTRRKSTSETGTPAEGDEPAKKPAKPRRSTRKKDDDGSLPMPSAEHRTAAGDDEPEARPFFFGGAGDDFDPDAPNDRFESRSAPRAEARNPQPEPDFDDGFGGEPSTRDRYADTPDTDAPAPAPRSAFGLDDSTPSGRSFEEEFGPPIRTEDDRRGGRRDDRRDDRRSGRREDRGPRRDDRRDDRGPRRDDHGPRPLASRGGPPPRDRGYPRPPIQEIFKRGQEVIVQVIKEAIGTKAPNLSTFISIAGRYLVLMPSLNRVGVSRKIEDVDARKRLRAIMTKLNPPKGVGFIVRTAAIERNETELQNDLAYLLRLWQVVARRIKRVAPPVEIYRESDMITRTIRDNFTADIDTIWVDEEAAFTHASDFLQVVMPRFANRIKFHADTEPLFSKYRVEDEIAKINSKRVELPAGGSIIIEQTEALVAIDVNSGNFRADNNAEETAFQVNMMAAKEIARQLRLRDLGGVIVNDFIDMRSEAHRRKVEETLAEALKRDRARTKILRISQFGIIEMTRQRIQTSLKKRVFTECGHCKGTGYTKTPESVSIEVMRLLQMAAHRTPAVSVVTVSVCMDVAFYLLNRKRRDISVLEQRVGMEVQVVGLASASPDTLEIKALDQNGNEVRLFQPSPPPPRMGRGPGPRALPDRRVPNLD